MGELDNEILAELRAQTARTVGTQGRVAHVVSLASLGMGLDPEAAPLGSNAKEED
jgi:hypothetical protein